MWDFIRSLRASNRNRSLPYVDPLRAGRHPFQTYLLILCVVSGLPYLFGQATAEAVNRGLPVVLATIWGLMLLFGAILALVGSYWHDIDIALTMERFGLYLTGVDGLIYGLCILAVRDPWSPFMASGVLLGIFLIRCPLPDMLHAHRKAFADTLTLTGVALAVAGGVLLMFSSAVSVAAGAFIIVGFGASCLRRAQDIAFIFKRARQRRNGEPPRIMREGELI